MEREQTIKMKSLLEEYRQLKAKLFPDNCPFSIVSEDDSKDWKRYNQLFAFFNPTFRTKNWINPLESKKDYFVMCNVGTVKYLVNYHDGMTAHNDGSRFYDIATFRNKRKRDLFIRELKKTGYKERGCQVN